jgi:hypothetical protein
LKSFQPSIRCKNYTKKKENRKKMSDLVTLVTAVIVLMTLLLLCFLTVGIAFGVWVLKNVGIILKNILAHYCSLNS